ncbi:LD-carboxypeptidase [Psychrobacter lutiphocae]|uniref:LD-carboxypeptidase n=1 Tax=Psychrobacter lutiphocae TaxID=540500 RepID=UPI000378F2D1|nr:LD-carboxypeptidase [Psychrobacter lutiphocae]
MSDNTIQPLNPPTTQSEGISQASTQQAQQIDIKRRRLLALSLLGMGGMGLATTPLHSAFAAPTSSTGACAPAIIPTRLFSSSNLVTDQGRSRMAFKRLACAGFDIKNKEVVQRKYMRFGGTDTQRSDDLQDIAKGIFAAPKLLLAIRGGYGAMRLLESVDWRSLGHIMQQHGTILAGFSDVTAIQCALLAQGRMSSVAAPMLYSEFGKSQPDKVSCQGFVEALTNPNLSIQLGQQSSSIATGRTISGVLWGGNLSVVSALAGSAYLPRPDGGIVFLEEVGEQPFRIERMLYSLYLAGAFKNQQAIVLGAFSRVGKDGYDGNYGLAQVMEHLSQLTNLPVYTGLPFGHVGRKQSFPLGAMCQLTASSAGVSLNFSGYPVIEPNLIYADALWQ